MLIRIRPTPTLILMLAPLGLRAAPLDGSTPAVGDAEARRLYDDANAYVSNVVEGPYSYAYMQFYWRRAESFLERAQRVYPDSPTGRALREGRLKVGPYELGYFRDKVLSRLEIKRVAAYDAVNCAIFLYERDTTRTDPVHTAAFEDIIEVMSRQERWGEVVGFPALGPLHTDLLEVMFREAVRLPDDQHIIINQCLGGVDPRTQAQARFLENQAEAMALLGVPRSQIASFLARHPQDAIKLAVLRGMAERETQIRRRAALRMPTADRITTEHYVLLSLKVRDDVDAVAREFWPGGPLPAAAAEILGAYHASLGDRPASDAPVSVSVAYLGYLDAFERFDDMESYAGSLELGPADRLTLGLGMIELYARAGRHADAERWAGTFRSAGGADADAAALADFRGRLNSTEDPLIVHSDTFAALPIKDPCVLAQAIMEWSLAPVRSLRGASPWDAVVLKYAPGFDKLPLPKSDEFRRAASATNPF